MNNSYNENSLFNLKTRQHIIEDACLDNSIFGSIPSTDSDTRYELINTGESFDHWVLPSASTVEVNELKSYLDCEHDTLIVDYGPFNADGTL